MLMMLMMRGRGREVVKAEVFRVAVLISVGLAGDGRRLLAYPAPHFFSRVVMDRVSR